MKKRGMGRHFWSLTVLFGGIGCGIMRPDYVKYAAPTTASNESSAECVAALQAFKDNIGSAVSGTCATANCHASTTISQKTLKSGDDTTNRSSLKGYTGSDPSKLFNKIAQKSGATHGGGDLSATLPLSQITKWTDAEAKCK